MPCIQHGMSSMLELYVGFAQQMLASVRCSRKACRVLVPATVHMRRPAALEQRSDGGAAVAFQIQIATRHSASEIRHPRDDEEKSDHLGRIMSHFVSLWCLQAARVAR